MPNPIPFKSHTLQIKPIPPASPTKPSVPLSEEFELNSRATIRMFQLARENGWKTLPKAEVKNGKLRIAGEAITRSYPADSIPLDATITIPPLDNPTAIIKRDDYLSLVVIGVEVGVAQDPSIGRSFRYRDPQTKQIAIAPPGTENSREYRSFWLLALSGQLLKPEDVLGSTSLETSGDRRIAILNNLDTGFLVAPGLRYWAADLNWVSGLAYTVLPDSIEVLPICTIKRIQNFSEGGFTQGFGGEAPLTNDLIATLASPKLGDLSTAVERRVREICSGIPGRGKTNKRIIVNLSAGQAGGNPGRAGVAAASPNGSYCMGNDQRVSFTNEQVTQKLGVQVVVASNDGSGKARLAVGLNTNAPLGSIFSPDRTQHRIYSTDGVEQSTLGSFSNLGGSGSLQWVAGDNSTIRPGSTAFFVPAIIYPAGSGFSVPFSTAEVAWYGQVSVTAALSAANVRFGMTEDLDTFQAPANGEPYIVVYGSERMALHYIYKLVNVMSDPNGVVTIPLAERGCFAFVQGVQGRVDAPVCQGVPPGKTVQALVYYPPRNQETWQFQLKYAEYQGIGVSDPTFLNGATIVSPVHQFIHTQGGGLSVHVTNSSLRGNCIAPHLPRVDSSVQPYEFNAPIQLPGEAYNGPITFRGDIPLLAARNLALPSPGQVLESKTVAGERERSLNAALYSNGYPLGFRSPVLASRSPFQVVVAFAAKKGDVTRLVVVTHNCRGATGEDVIIDASQETAIDVFEL